MRKPLQTTVRQTGSITRDIARLDLYATDGSGRLERPWMLVDLDSSRRLIHSVRISAEPPC